MDKQVALIVSGRVQGVRFRKTVQEEALRLGLRGVVRNISDGTVSISVQGAEDSIATFIAWLRKSPGFSSVANIEERPEATLSAYTTFSIEREGNTVQDQKKSFTNLVKNMFRTTPAKIPTHVALIPDGNRRWAKQHGLQPSQGHAKAAQKEHLHELLRECIALGIKYVSLWAFSTENWKRSEQEREKLFATFAQVVVELRDIAAQEQIRIRWLGRRDRIPTDLAQQIIALEKETATYDHLHVQLLLDYGGRDEIVRAFNKAIRNAERRIDEETLATYLDTANLPDPDLIIRTSGEHRLSGLYPWQATYAEIVVVQKHFPAFGAKDLRKAVHEYARRSRRFGGN